MKTITYKANKILKVLFALSLCFLFVINKNAKAGTLWGGEISYKATSTPGVFLVSFKCYMNCEGVTICSGCNIGQNGNMTGCTTSSSGWTLQVTGLSPGYVGINYGSFVLNIVPSTSGFDILQTCPTAKTICTNCNTRTAGTYSPGIEVFNFEGLVNIASVPTACCRIGFTASTCCRSNYLTTIAPSSFFSIAELDRCQSTFNSAPVFVNEAPIIACAGNDFSYNLGAIDVDGDSLSYAFGPTFGSLNTPVTYLQPFSVNYPFPYLGAPNANAAYPAGIRLNPITGDLLVRPVGLFNTSLVIQVTQWKLINGVYVNVGITRRDVQFQSISCATNKIPIIKIYNKNVLSNENITAYARQQICLNIVAEDQQTISFNPLSADTTDLSWNNPNQINPYLSNATFTRNYILSQRELMGPKADSFKFCWTPPTSAIRTLPHAITITGSDRNCPLKSLAQKGINLFVKNPFVNIEPTTQNSFCNNTSTPLIINYKVNGVNILPSNTFFVLLSDSLGSFTNATYLATKVDTLLEGTISVIIPQGLAINKNYNLKILNTSDNLSDAIVFPISIVPGVVSPVLSVNKNSFCYNGSKALFQVNTVSNSSYKWFLNNQLIVGSNSSSYFADSTGNYKVLVSNTGCADTSNSILLVVHQKPKANFTCVDTACISEIFNFIVITNNSSVSQGTINSNWIYSDGTTENTPNPVKVVNNSNNLNIKLIITSNNSCTDSTSKTVILKQKPIASFVINDSTQCLKNNYFSFTNSTQNGTFYTWDLGNNDISNLTNPTKIFTDTGNYLIKLKVESNNSCKDSITKSVTISPNTIANFDFDTTVQCLKTNNFQFINSSKNFNNQIWYFGDTTNSTILNPTKKFSNPGTFIVKLVAKNGASCADSISKTVTVISNPTIGNINGNATPTSLNQPFNYNIANQTNVDYNWTVVNGIIQNGQGTNSINVIWPNVGNGKVKLKVFNNYNCVDSTELNTSITSVGIDEFNLNNSLMAYPIPTKNTIIITSKLNLTNKQFTISNIVGQIVLSGKLNNNETTLNLVDLPNGLYLLNMEGSLDKSIKIIKE